MSEPSDLERDLQALAADLRRLESEYAQYFGGRTPRPPNETRARVDSLLKRLDRRPFEQLAQRFRFQTLQARYSTFAELWDRNARRREEGRAPLAHAAGTTVPPPQGPRVVDEVLLNDPVRDIDRLERLHAALVDARREVGEPAVPFDTFAELVRQQVAELTGRGAGEITFRVAIKDGRARLTARGTKDVGEEREE